jgi:hypothetical protein
MSSKALVSTIAIAAAVAVPAASAHTLSKATAKREATKAVAALAGDLGGAPVVQCTRKSDHVFVCQVSAVTGAGDVCVTTVRVAYRGRHDRKVSRRVLGGPTCETPEIGGIL